MVKQMKSTAIEYPFLLMTLILSESQCQKFIRLAKEKEIRSGIITLGKGTVKSATLNLLGIKSQKKQIISTLLRNEKVDKLLDYFTEELQLYEPGHGIAYTTPVITAGRLLNTKGEWGEQEMEVESMYKKLTVIVNRGMAEEVMDVARKSGVKGGTIMHGRGTGSDITEKVFGMEIEPEKDLVIILMPTGIINKVVKELYQEFHMDQPGNGIMFVEPVVEVRGLSDLQQNQQNT